MFVDGFYTTQIEMEGVQNSVTEELHHNGVSAEDDSFLTSSSSLTFLNLQFSENQIEKHDFGLSDPGEVTRAYEDSGLIESLHQPSETSEAEKSRRSGKCNLRKSLAWDNAFFTNAGVLDAEELSSMIGGVDHGKHVLPGIQEEDLQRSMESISTLDSELTLDSDLTLESLEADLFQDIRASIQKSNKAPMAANSSATARSREKDPQALKSSNKVAPVSRNKATVKQASSKLNIDSQGSGKEVKKSSVPEFSQKKPATKNSEPTSSIPKVPRPSGKVNLIPVSPTKSASFAGSNRVKTETSTAAVRGASLPKVPSARNVVPRPTLSSKSTAMRRSSTTAGIGPNTSSSSLDRSTRTSSVNAVKAQTICLKGKSNARVSNPLNSGQTPKTPSRISLRDRSEPGNSHLSDYLRSSSTSKSSSISPSSSISEWSSESFSSTSTVNQRSSNSKLTTATSSPNGDHAFVHGVPKGINMQMHTDQHVLGGQKNLVDRLSGQSISRPLTGTSTLPLQAAAKPSGLRMPSPKIGFFDGVKLQQVRTPKGGMQPLSSFVNIAGSCSPRDENSSKLKKFQSGEATIEVQGNELSRTLEAIDLNSGTK